MSTSGLITDLVIPIQAGVETIIQIRRASPDVPVIANRASARREPSAKPFTPQYLLEVVGEVLVETARMPPSF